MAGSAFPSTTARVVALLALTAAVAAGLPVPAGAYKPSAGTSCKCARASSAGSCVVLCKAGTGGEGSRCPCVRTAVDDVTLVPTQVLPGGPRSGGGVKGEPLEAQPTQPAEPVKPSAPAPAPQKPPCKANRAILSVEGAPWGCVRSMNIKKWTAAEAYDFRNAQNNGWATQDDYINLNFLRDAASRLYLCVTYGSPVKSDLPGEKRAASSVLTSTSANRFYFQDDVPVKTKAGQQLKGDRYSPADGSASRTLAASHQWNDVKTDGYCVDVAAGMVVDFSGLSYVKGLALGKGSATEGYPATGEWTYWDMDTKAPTKSLTYDSAGRVYPAKVQTKKWSAEGSPPPNSVRRVTITAACGCGEWKAKAKKAAVKAARKAAAEAEGKKLEPAPEAKQSAPASESKRSAPASVTKTSSPQAEKARA
ncbi:hypothetical protein I4F81_010110 [Pyropia yezoensis]|uniref:Uncharacterized protein n=1 Tax=Pyropia yezoensis TaxID=2788 RepID=A0ACC3CBD0_PYRYE|nr:hypothetical protein I4F81_010110 [Neopyropia yezoensis]